MPMRILDSCEQKRILRERREVGVDRLERPQIEVTRPADGQTWLA
jgi:hypothetical protein